MTTELKQVRRASGTIALLVSGVFIVALLLAVIAVIVGGACYDWFGTGVDEREIYYIAQKQMTQSQLGPRWTEDGAHIVFQHGFAIYAVDSDGTRVTRWVPGGAPKSETFAFDFSPDVGQMPSRIVYSTLRHIRNDNKYLEIATAYLDGSGYRRLTDSAGDDAVPAWSPDGAKIAFLSNRAGLAPKKDNPGGRGFNVYIMDADGSDVKRVAPDIFLTDSRYAPMWSRDGAYLSFRQSRFLHTVDTLSYATENLGSIATDPAWSPDGAWIAFFSHTSPTLHVTRPDGSERHKVFTLDDDSQVGASDLSWSTDGSQLRFSLSRKGQEKNKRILYEIGIDGLNLQEIVEVPTGSRIAWSPDASRIAVLSPDGPFDPIFGNALLYVMRPDGSDRQVLVRVDYRRGLEAVGHLR